MCLTTGSTSAPISTDCGVGVAVGEQAREGAAPGHAVAPGVVDDEHGPRRRLGALGRDAGACADAYEDLARSDLLAELLKYLAISALPVHSVFLL